MERGVGGGGGTCWDGVGKAEQRLKQAGIVTAPLGPLPAILPS